MGFLVQTWCQNNTQQALVIRKEHLFTTNIEFGIHRIVVLAWGLPRNFLLNSCMASQDRGRKAKSQRQQGSSFKSVLILLMK